MDVYSFIKKWAVVMLMIFVVMAIISISMEAIFKRKMNFPEEEVALDLIEDATVDAVEIALTYKDGRYLVDTDQPKWQIDCT